MRKAVLTLLVILAGAAAAFAGNCTMTTYNVYIAHGFSCGIGTDTFSGFGYVGTSNPPGSGIPASSIMVTPITTPGNPGLQFAALWSVSNTSGVLEQDSLFQSVVKVNAGGNPLTDLTLSIAGASFTGTGEVIVTEIACLGAMLPTCTGGEIKTLTVFDDARGSQLVDTISFAGVSEISVSKDLTLSAGTAGSASLASVTDQYTEGLSTVPEPGTLSTIGLGAVALAGFARRKLGL